MPQNVVSIDGVYYDISIPESGITRSFEIADTDKAKRLINGNMVRDVIGTYYNYTVAFNTKNLNRAEYDRLYEQISAPVDSHTIAIPYGQSILTFEAYVTNGQDVLKKIDAEGNKWEGITINFIAMQPKRRPL